MGQSLPSAPKMRLVPRPQTTSVRTSTTATQPCNHKYATRSRTRNDCTTTITAKADTVPKLTTAACTTEAYRNRDSHEMFFRPTTKQAHPAQRVECKRTKNKRKFLTTKQRAAEAQTHYIMYNNTSRYTGGCLNLPEMQKQNR